MLSQLFLAYGKGQLTRQEVKDLSMTLKRAEGVKELLGTWENAVLNIYFAVKLKKVDVPGINFLTKRLLIG